MASISITPTLSLTEVRRSDRESYVEYLKDREIYENTLLIPYPYSLADADKWIAMNEQWQKESPKLTSFAIRGEKGVLVGNAGFHDLKPGVSYKAEIGYWIAKCFWGQGYATLVVAKLVDIGFQEFNLKRISATVFTDNESSQRVLEKNGFHLEGTLRNYYLKDGKLIDAKLYAKVS